MVQQIQSHLLLQRLLLVQQHRLGRYRQQGQWLQMVPRNLLDQKGQMDQLNLDCLEILVDLGLQHIPERLLGLQGQWLHQHLLRLQDLLGLQGQIHQ